MRVLLLARYLQKVNHRKVEILAAQPGIELWHIAPSRWTDSLGSYSQELAHGRGYHFVPTTVFPHRDIHRFLYWPPTLHLTGIRPDIIHLEEEPDSLVALETVCARRLLAPAARLVVFSWQNTRRPMRRSVQALCGFVLRHVDHAIAGNSEAVQVLRERGYDGEVTVLPQLGVDTRIFKPGDSRDLRRQLGLGQFVAGFVGRFVPEKGLTVLLEAAARIEGAHVLLVGSGPMQSPLQSLAQSLAMTDRLTIVNTVAHDDVPRYMNAMDVLVLPSLTTAVWKEQFGHVLIEAMACGTPVVGSDSGAIPEVIGSAGLVFPEGNVDALVTCLSRVRAGGADDLRRAAMEKVLKNYTHEHIVEATVRVYETVLSRKRRRAA